MWRSPVSWKQVHLPTLVFSLQNLAFSNYPVSFVFSFFNNNYVVFLFAVSSSLGEGAVPMLAWSPVAPSLIHFTGDGRVFHCCMFAFVLWLSEEQEAEDPVHGPSDQRE